MGIAEDVLDFLFDGMIDPDEIFKMDDASEVHVPGNLRTTARKKKQAWDEKTPGQKVAIATNAAGAVAGPAAIYSAVKQAKEGKGGIPRDLARSIGGQRGKRLAAVLDSPKTRNAKLAAGAAATGMVGLQIANWAGDTIATKEMSKPKNQLIDEAVGRTKKEDMIHKSIRDAIMAGVPAEQVMEIVSKTAANQAVIDAAKRGQMILGATAATGVGAAGYGIGRKRTRATVDDALNERLGPPRPPKRIPPKKVPGEVPVVVQSKYEVKKDDGPDLTWEGEISKVDSDKRHVFGWCSLSKVDGEDVIDKQDDYIPIEETEKAAYEYVVHSRKGGDMHRRDGEVPLHTSDMIESFVVTPEKLSKMGLPDDALPHGWWVGFKVNDDNLWEEVKDGKKVHFSVHGRGRRVPKEV